MGQNGCKWPFLDYDFGGPVMRISGPEVSYSERATKYAVNVHMDTCTRPLWYEVNCDRYFVSSRLDAAALAMLLPAMRSGIPLVLDGPVSERLFYNISGPLQHVIKCIIPSLRVVDVKAENILRTSEGCQEGVATGFSGGVDSFDVLAHHHYGCTSVGYRLTHLVHSNVGSHGAGGETLFRERVKRLAPVAHVIGLPLLVVHSNLADFYETGLGFQQTHTIRNASVALVLQRRIGRYLYASAYEFSKTALVPTGSMAHADPVLLPQCGTESVEMLSVGGERSRVAKTVEVARLGASYSALDVCVNDQYDGPRVNCGVCWKCVRTGLTLEVLGRLEEYWGVFDLEAYFERRDKSIAALLVSNNPLDVEVREFAQKQGFRFPMRARLLSFWRRRFVFRMLRKLRSLGAVSWAVVSGWVKA